MQPRLALFTLFVALFCAAVTGCQRPAAPVTTSPTVLSPDTLASVHWVGKRRLDLQADAYFFSRIWSLPETTRLQTQTFDRLATGTWRVLLGDAAAAQIPAAVLRPLLDDLAQTEAYVEVRAATNASPALALAVHVDVHRAGLWETNLAVAVQLLTGRPATADPAKHGWTLQPTNSTDRLTLTRVSDWTVVSAGPEPNALAAEITARIQREGVPFVSAGTNLWLEADLSPARLVNTFSRSARRTGGAGRGEVDNPSAIFHLLSAISHVGLALTGDGGNVITRGQVTLAQPLAALTPWQLPSDLLHEPLTSFNAVRGLQPWLAAWPVWQALPLGTPPDQGFFWSLADSPYQAYFAAPLPETSRSVATLTDWLLQTSNPWLAAHGYVGFDRAPDGNGVTWGNQPDIRPFIKGAGDPGAGWLFAGLFPDDRTATASPPPAGMIQDILRRTNLVYYGWEVTGPRLPACFQISQTACLLAHQPQMAPTAASLTWLTTIAPRLGTAATIVKRTGPAELSFYRRSTLGLTATELQFLADWLESPQFPGRNW